MSRGSISFRPWGPRSILEMRALGVRKALRILAFHRIRLGDSFGDARGWARALAEVTVGIKGVDATVFNVDAQAVVVGLFLDRAMLEAELNDVLQRRLLDPQAFRLASAEDLGALVRLTAIERDNLFIRTIGSFDENPAARRRRRDRERKAGQRQLAGRRPHSGAKERTKPWEALKVSRSTFYAKLRR